MEQTSGIQAMSDTPISDLAAHNIADLGMLCRKFERELNAAQKRIELLESANSDVARIAKERDDAILRIKKMVIIGDRLCVFSSNYGYTNNWILSRYKAIKSWKKARNKESKP